MGTHEDDRIRAKNKVAQAAYDLYSSLTKEGTSDPEIAMQMNDLVKLDPANPRNDVYLSVLKIIGSKEHDSKENASRVSSVEPTRK